ncbi:MAG: MFS transporter [Anaerolineae bacterium]|nr:MFS transporter [Anaerolineae bacterium]
MTTTEMQYQPRMTPNQPDKLNIKRTISLSLAFMSVLAGLGYYNLAVPLLLGDAQYGLVPQDMLLFGVFGQQTVIGAILVLDNVLALLLQPYFAALSDRARSKFGRRMPFIIIGVLSAAFFFTITPLFKALLGLVAILFCFNVAMAFYRSAALTLLADYTPDAVRSKGSGLQQLIANAGAIFAFLLPTLIGLLRPGILTVESRYLGFPITAVVMILILVLLFRTIKETPTGNGFLKIGDTPIEIDPVDFTHRASGDIAEKKKRDWVYFRNALFGHDRSMLFLMIYTYFSYTAFASIEAFFTIFANNYLGIGDQQAGQLLLIYTASMILSAFASGMLGQKLGRRKALRLGTTGLIVVMSLLAFVVTLKQPLWIAVLFVPVGFFWMTVIVNIFPVLWSLSPRSDEGTYTGIYYSFNQAAYVFGPILMGLVFDVIGKGMGTDRYLLMFPFIVFCEICAFVLLYGVKGGEARLSEAEIKALRERLVESD